MKVCIEGAVVLYNPRVQIELEIAPEHEKDIAERMLAGESFGDIVGNTPTYYKYADQWAVMENELTLAYVNWVNVSLEV